MLKIIGDKSLSYPSLLLAAQLHTNKRYQQKSPTLKQSRSLCEPYYNHRKIVLCSGVINFKVIKFFQEKIVLRSKKANYRQNL